MIASHAVFKNGIFYNEESKEPIEFNQGSEYIIFSAQEGKIRERKQQTNCRILNQEQKKKQVESISISSCIILNANTNLYFIILNRGTDFMFEAKILEDLYLPRKAGWKNSNERLFPCECELTKILNGTLEIAESIKAHSLNELYKNTYIYFFNNDGNPACNALERFYTKKDNSLSTLSNLRTNYLFS